MKAAFLVLSGVNLGMMTASIVVWAREFRWALLGLPVIGVLAWLLYGVASIPGASS